MTEALTRARPRIDDPEELDRVVGRLVDAFDPLAIYLFGSRARGDAGDESDYDLMLVLTDDNARVRSRQAIWETARSDRIDVNPFVSREGAFAWRRHEVGTLEYEVQVDGIRLYPTSGADLRFRSTARGQRSSMSAKVVGEWLEKVRRDLVIARKACEGDDAVPDQAAYHVQQAAEKLTKAALVALQKRPRKGHEIGEFAKRLPATFALRERFLALERFTKFVWVYRYPGEEGAPSEPEPSVAEAWAWIAELETLKSDFERWLAARESSS
jgi:HEPN domain-containing protein/predicted nucleotidyltransferase